MMSTSPVRIIWHHVGREHGTSGSYAPDLRLNPPEVVEAYLAAKEAMPSPNRCFRQDADTLIELPPVDCDRQWIIVYLLDSNLQLSLGYKSHPWWLADIVSFSSTKSGATIVRDLILDVEIDEDLQYRILDGDEFAHAVQASIIRLGESLIANQTLHDFIQQLESNSFPTPRLHEIVSQYWPEPSL